MIITDGDKVAAAILVAVQLVGGREKTLLEQDFRQALQLVTRFQTSKEVAESSVPNIHDLER